MLWNWGGREERRGGGRERGAAGGQGAAPLVHRWAREPKGNVPPGV